MSRIASPWFWDERNGWYVTKDGQRHFLGEHPDGAPPPRKHKGRWNAPTAIVQAFHALMVTTPEASPQNVPSGMTAAEVFDKFLDWCRRHREPRTTEWYHDHLQSFIDLAGAAILQPATALKPFAVVEWADAHADWSAAYRRGAIIAIQRPFNWAMKLGYIDANPIRHIEKPEAQRRETYVSPDTWRKIRDHYAAGDPFRDIITFCWDTGCRPQEAKRIEARHVDLRGQCVVFPKEEAKGKRRPRIIHLTDEAAAILTRLVRKHPNGLVFLNEDGHAWTAQAMACRFTRLKKHLGVKFACYDLRHGFANRNIIKMIEKQKAARAERLKDLLAEDKKDDGLVFDELGVDHIFYDEAQAVKNLATPTKMDRVAGIQSGGSERSFDVYMKARFLGEKHPGHGVTFATGTPISNSIGEMYTMQRFLDPEGLRSRGIEHFDAWAANFGEVVESMEIAPDGKTLRPRSRFAKFVNLPELQQLFRSFADVQTPEMLDLPRPQLAGGKPTVIACPMSDKQRDLQQELVARYERLRSQKVDPREDNALAITTDGRKLALDARMLTASAPDFPNSKVNALVDNVFAIWQRTTPTLGAQMIFSDFGVHPTPWGYSAYDQITEKLIARGIPRQEIASVGEADSDAKKQALFARVRSGAVRVLLGSTQKMGTGVNVQKRLAALHHLDAPWKPAEVEQREGRILRQGNENAEVAIYRYVTEGSFDAFMWQALETKARFISQVMTGETAVRRAEDVGGQELSYAEVKAIASGNPAVLTLAEADAELQRLSVLKRNHADEQFLARRNLRDLPATIDRLSKRLADLSADRATATAHADDPLTIGNRSYSHGEAIEALGGSLNALPSYIPERRRFPLGVYRGLRFGIVLHPQFVPEVYLEGAVTQQSMLSREHHGPRAILNAVERLASGYGSECDRVRQDLTIAEGQLRDYQARLGKPFLHEDHLLQLTALRDQLKAGLSGAQPEPGAEPPPTVSELAERIKTLKANHAVEATPQRVVRRRPAAEESVTARIRQRTGGIPEPAAKPDAALPANATAEAPNAPAHAENGSHSARVLAGRTGQADLRPAAARPRQRVLF